MGFFDRISRGWGFIKEAFAMAKEERVLLKPSLYSVFAGIAYWVIWVVIFVGAEVDFDSGAGKAMGAVATFGSFAIFYFFMGMTVNMVDVHVKGGKPTLTEAYLDAKQNFGAILFLALISTIVELIAKAARRSASEEGGAAAIIMSIAASIVESIWTMMAFLLLPAIIIEDASLGDSLRRVRDISKGNLMQIAIGDVGVRMVTNLIGLLVMLLLFGVFYVSFGVMGGTTGTILGVTIGGTILSLFAAFSSYLRMAYYTCLYIWAADCVDKGPQAPAPLPLARVLR
tara:strand:+ start:128744 stop:129598 length:855 start_codon:yes stop_codon:yes gene_type:complete